MKLTKEQAIEEHRKMWNWIADQYEEGCTADVYALKEEYMQKGELEGHILHNCFCCEYATQSIEAEGESRFLKCSKCPVIWGTEMFDILFPCEHYNSKYQLLKSESCKLDKLNVNSELCVRLAREIANLPERECL